MSTVVYLDNERLSELGDAIDAIEDSYGPGAVSDEHRRALVTIGRGLRAWERATGYRFDSSDVSAIVGALLSVAGEPRNAAGAQ